MIFCAGVVRLRRLSGLSGASGSEQPQDGQDVVSSPDLTPEQVTGHHTPISGHHTPISGQRTPITGHQSPTRRDSGDINLGRSEGVTLRKRTATSPVGSSLQEMYGLVSKHKDSNDKVRVKGKPKHISLESFLG